jgi:hypothetical protein
MPRQLNVRGKMRTVLTPEERLEAKALAEGLRGEGLAWATVATRINERWGVRYTAPTVFRLIEHGRAKELAARGECKMRANFEAEIERRTAEHLRYVRRVEEQSFKAVDGEEVPWRCREGAARALNEAVELERHIMSPQPGDTSQTLTVVFNTGEGPVQIAQTPIVHFPATRARAGMTAKQAKWQLRAQAQVPRALPEPEGGIT